MNSPRERTPSKSRGAQSPVTTPSMSLQDCDPQKNVLMKRNGLRGVIVAAVVTGTALLIILISKWNEIRQQRVPFVWRSRLKTMLQDCASLLKLAQESTVPGTSYKHAIEASTLLTSAKKLVGTADLSKLSGYDISKLESEIESLLRRNIPNSLLLKEDKDDKKKDTAPKKKFQISQGPKQHLEENAYRPNKMKDVAEMYKLQYEESLRNSAR